MDNVVKVGMADLKTGRNTDMITTLGLGSCIGIALYDPTTKIGGLAHIMLPDSTAIKNNSAILMAPPQKKDTQRYPDFWIDTAGPKRSCNSHNYTGFYNRCQYARRA